MKFEPKSYFVGNQLANYSSILLLVLLVLAIGYEIYIYIGKQTEQGDPLKKTKK
jgi:hypothetical protein